MKDIESRWWFDFCYLEDNYDYKNEGENAELQHKVEQWIKENYCWMNSKNINALKSFETKWRKEWNLTQACSNILTVMKT